MSYQISVRGHLGPTMLAAFPGLDAGTYGEDTVLTGVLDQAALHGALAQIEALGLELLLVRRLPGGPGSESPDGGTRAHPDAQQAETSQPSTRSGRTQP
jgi:hypothetical protein